MHFSSYKARRRLSAGLLAAVLMFVAVFPLLSTPVSAVSRSDLDALKQQQSKLAEQKAGIQAQANALSSQLASQTEQLDLLGQQLEVTGSEMENLTEQIAIYTNSIAVMENQLNADKLKEAELIAHYKVRVRAMEENGNATYIAILMGATSFQDLLSRIDSMREIMQYDSGLIEDIKQAQLEVAQAKAKMEDEMAAQQQAFADYQDKQADLLRQQEQVQAVLATLSASSAEYQQQLDAVKALEASIGSQITSVADQLAEQERLKAEQEAANQAGSGSNSGGTWYGDLTGSGSGQDIVNYAETFLGVNYVYGGTSPSGFDCSGLVYYCYRHFGYSVNRTAAGLSYSGRSVSASELQPGDVILFTSVDGSYIGHCGIYIGGGQFIHAPHTGDVVKISSLSDTYYTSHYCGARRIIS